MNWTVYLSGEIHTDWRKRIADGIAAAGLPVSLTGPVTHHEASDDCGVAILGGEPDKFWHDHKGAQMNAIRTRTLIEKADAWITAHMAEKTEIGALARHLAVTPRTLHRRFSETLGQSPQQFIARRKLERAKHLLETTAMSQQQVMAAIGYQDLTAFRRAFKTHSGLSPVQYRKEFQRLGSA